MAGGANHTLLLVTALVCGAAAVCVSSDAIAAGETNQAALEGRIGAQIARQPELLMRGQLAVDGHDLQRELGIPPGPELGAVLERLTEAVLDDPSRNERSILLELARQR